MRASDLHDINSIFPLCGKIQRWLLKGDKIPLAHARSHAAPSRHLQSFSAYVFK